MSTGANSDILRYNTLLYVIFIYILQGSSLLFFKQRDRILVDNCAPLTSGYFAKLD